MVAAKKKGKGEKLSDCSNIIRGYPLKAPGARKQTEKKIGAETSTLHRRESSIHFIMGNQPRRREGGRLDP